MENTNKKVHKVVGDTKPLGSAWGAVIQAMVTEVATRRARVQLMDGKYSTANGIDDHMPILLHLRFMRDGSDVHKTPPTIACACTCEVDEHGGSICTCTGSDAASCDCGAIVV